MNDIAVVSFAPDEFAKSKYAGMPFMRNTLQINGRVLREVVRKGEVFAPEAFYPEGMGPGVAELLTKGYRAVTVPIENVGAVYGFARPGSYVDILFRAKAVGERPEVTITLLERVQVLALNANTLAGSQVSVDQKGAVTLAVTPQQAKVLKVVESHGDLTLTLRNPDDTQQFSPIDLSDFDHRIGQVNHAAANLPVRFAADGRAITDLSRVTGAAENVTLDDLLGLPGKPRKKSMEVFLGANKSVLDFEVPEEEAFELLRRGGRIRTPIAHEVAPPAPPEFGSAELDRFAPQLEAARGK